MFAAGWFTYKTNTKSMAKLRRAKPKNRDGETFKLNKNYKK